MAHLTAVLVLHPAEQDVALHMAVEKGWTAKELRKQMGKAAPGTRAAPAKGPPVMAVVRRLERVQKTTPELGCLRDLKDRDRERIERVVEGTKAWCEAVECWLKAGADEN